jgi:mono/diheme cytochrome c family protein
MKGVRVVVIVTAMVAGLPSLTAVAQVISPAPFTQAQADAGRQDYMINCASCHGDDLSGKGVPALAGTEFAKSQIGDLTTAQLYTYIQSTMPYDRSGSLNSETYLNILAFILEANGAKPGGQTLKTVTDVKVGDIVTGIPPTNFLHNAEAK